MNKLIGSSQNFPWVMYMTNSIIKQESKQYIKGKRKNALSIVLFVLIFGLIATLLCFGTIFFSELLRGFGAAVTVASVAVLVILSLATVFIYSSASVGEKAWYTGLTANKSNYKKRLYFWFKPRNSFRAFKFRFILSTVRTLWAIVFFLPAGIVLWSIYYLSGSGGLELYLFISLAAGCVLLTVSGAVFYFITIQRYFLAEYLFSSNPKLTPVTAIRQSKNLLDGHIFEIVRFKLSFLPWFLSCIFIVPIFYFLPYYKESCCVVAKKVTL